MAARELTLPVSGAVVGVRRIPSMLLDDYRKSMPKTPTPPMQEVEYNGVKSMEPNPSHPDYAQTMRDYLYNLGIQMIAFAVRFGVEVTVDEQAVKELRDWAQENGVQLPTDDKLLYVTRILAQGEDDLAAIQEAVFGRVQPTEATVEQTVQTFPSPVQGS